MKLKIGIIGLGVGEAHIEGYQAHPGCEVIAACDFSAEKLSQVKARYPGLSFTAKAEDILDNPEINAVSIASYDNYHFEQIKRAIANGKHLFVEKPVCLHEEEARILYGQLRKNPRIKLSSNLILRMCPRFIKLKEMVRQNQLGKIYHIEGDYLYGRIHKITEGWRGKLDYYSVMLGGGVHIIDLFTWLMNDRLTEVAAYGNQIASQGSQFRFNDFSIALLKFQSGALGKVSANFGCVHPHFHELKLYGTQKTFVNTADAGLLYESRDPNQKPSIMAEAYPCVKKGDLLYDFVDSIISGKSPMITFQSVFDVMSVCFAIEKSMNRGQPVSVDYFE